MKTRQDPLYAASHDVCGKAAADARALASPVIAGEAADAGAAVRAPSPCSAGTLRDRAPQRGLARTCPLRDRARPWSIRRISRDGPCALISAYLYLQLSNQNQKAISKFCPYPEH